MISSLVDRFWKFWGTAADPAPLAVLRIGTAAVGLLQLAVLWPSLLALYGNRGLIQWVLVDAGKDALLPSLGDLALLADRAGITSSHTVHLVFAVYGACLLGVLLGARPRLFAGGALLTHLLTVNSGYLSLYGVDTMLHVSLFYLVFIPSAGRWSIDAWRGIASSEPTVGARIGLRALQLHVCLVYLNAGFSKAQGAQWWSGEALWRALMLPHFAVFDLSFLADFPVLLQFGCLGTLLIECGYALAVWVPLARKPWLLATIGLHLGIGALMGLWLFSLMMIVLSVSAFWVPTLGFKAASRRVREPRETGMPLVGV